MAFIPTPNGVKICLRMTKAGQQVCNVFHVKVATAPTMAELEVIAGIFISTWQTYLQNVTASDVSFDAVEATDISVAGGLGVEVTSGLPLVGTSIGGPMPNNVTVATKLTTGMTGRSHRGRSYDIGLTENNITADRQHITAGLIAVFTDYFTNLISALAGNSTPLAVLSLFADKLPRAAGVLTNITNSSTNATLDSQRRRLPERGS